MNRSRVLVVDDDDAIREFVTRCLGSTHDVTPGASLAEAVSALEACPHDVLLTDLVMPGGGGVELMRRARALSPGIGVVVMTGQGSLSVFRDLLRLGVSDYLLKPFSADVVVRTVARVVELHRLARENDSLRIALGSPPATTTLIGSSPVMEALRSRLALMAAVDSTVLVTGATGTGKELVARHLHASSGRAEKPFVVVNCGALVETLLESELFGHARGSFTGAVTDRVGCFEAAGGGTLFLDEVGAMTPAVQVRLLRVLGSREIVRVGETRPRPIDARVIAATNVPLERLVREGKFREDLYYRLKVLSLQVPSLAERGEDVRELALHHLRLACERFGRPPQALSEGALRVLRSHPWPGNVRELENAVARAVITAGSSPVIGAEHVSLRPVRTRADTLPAEGLDLAAHLEACRRAFIGEALRRSAGNRGEAARLLGLKRTTLVEQVRRLEQGGAAP